MTIDEMKRRKKELGYTYAQISELSGVPIGTVQKIFGGTTKAPRYDTLRALEQVLEESLATYVYETQAAYDVKKQGQYTVEDYYEMPEECRMELIDGVIYDMTSPSSVHQLIAGLLHAKFLDYITKNKGSCLPIISPIDVQLDCDNRTMVEPDVVVVCDRNKVIRRCVYGAPDLVIEILSPSSVKKDSVIKLNKYMNAGVREYWLIDPDCRKVMIYDFQQEVLPAIYGFNAKIPVGIWDGDCVIDFNEIYEYIRFLYEEQA